jgi:hypothetical protein
MKVFSFKAAPISSKYTLEVAAGKEQSFTFDMLLSHLTVQG